VREILKSKGHFDFSLSYWTGSALEAYADNKNSQQWRERAELGAILANEASRLYGRTGWGRFAAGTDFNSGGVKRASSPEAVMGRGPLFGFDAGARSVSNPHIEKAAPCAKCRLRKGTMSNRSLGGKAGERVGNREEDEAGVRTGSGSRRQGDEGIQRARLDTDGEKKSHQWRENWKAREGQRMMQIVLSEPQVLHMVLRSLRRL